MNFLVNYAFDKIALKLSKFNLKCAKSAKKFFFENQHIKPVLEP